MWGGRALRSKPPSLSSVSRAFPYHMLLRISAYTTAVTVCIYDILTDTEKEQVFCISATILPQMWQKKKCLKELSEALIV